VSDAEVEARALSDPDNPPLDEQQLKRMALAREVRLIREKSGFENVVVESPDHWNPIESAGHPALP
jgi:hypothetical protein